MVLEQLDIHKQNQNKQTKKPEHPSKSSPLSKLFKMDHKFKCSKSVKLLEKNTGENLQDLGLAKEFLDVKPIA